MEEIKTTTQMRKFNGEVCVLNSYKIPPPNKCWRYSMHTSRNRSVSNRFFTCPTNNPQLTHSLKWKHSKIKNASPQHTCRRARAALSVGGPVVTMAPRSDWQDCKAPLHERLLVAPSPSLTAPRGGSHVLAAGCLLGRLVRGLHGDGNHVTAGREVRVRPAGHLPLRHNPVDLCGTNKHRARFYSK